MRNPPTSAGRPRRRRMAALLAAVLAAVLLPALPPTNAASAAPDGPWQLLEDGPSANRSGRPADIEARRLAAYTLDRSMIAGQLDRAPDESARPRSTPLVLAVPTPEGGLQRFEVVDSPVMESGLAAAHPEIRTYAGKGLDDPTATIRADLTPLGFHASVRSTNGAWYVDPYHRDQSVYASYYAHDLVNRHGDLIEREDVEHAVAELEAAQPEAAAGPAVRLRTYRLALVTDPSYATYFGPENVTAAKVTLVNRVTQIYEDETAIRLVLVNDTDKTNLNTAALASEPNGPCGASPCYTEAQLTGCTGSTLNRNRIVLGQLIGASAYDVGHIGFGLPGGGVAGLGVVGGDGKARGCTGLPNPIGDFFAVDYVAHEIGHQFGGNHTFNGTQWNCSGGNRSAANSYEPGSGSSIMAYAGICQQDNLQPHSDPYWSQRSYTEITTVVNAVRPAINEVQTVSLRDFDTDGDAFAVRYAGQTSAPIVRGGNYTTDGIKAAIEGISGWPAGATVTVAAFGGSGALTDVGFQVTFNGGPLAATNVGALGLANLVGAAGFVGETAKGGPVDNGGWRVEELANRAPVVAVPAAYTIPVRTPFALTGSATDADGDPLTYLWEQNDRGGISGVSNAGTALVDNVKTNGPLFRVFGQAAIVGPEDTQQYYSPGLNAVGTDPTRVFPDTAQILAGNTNAKTGTCPAAPAPPASGSASNVPPAVVDCYSEFLPTADWVGYDNDRTMHFKLTARDSRPGGGGIGSAQTALTLAPEAGPFLVTSQPRPAFLLGGSSQEITWDVANTDVAPVNAAQVKISLSTDGAKTFPYVLAEAVPNNGSATVVLPNIETTTGRIKIEAVGNVFFDLNDADIRISQVRPATVAYTGDTQAFATSEGALAAEVLLRASVTAEAGDVRGVQLTFKEGDTTLCSAEVKLWGAAGTDGSASCRATLPLGVHQVAAEVTGRYTGSATAEVVVTRPGGLALVGDGYLRSDATAGAYPLDPDHRVELDLDARVSRAGELLGKVKVGYRSGDKRYKFQGTQAASFATSGSPGNGQAQLRYLVTLYDISTPQSPVPVATDLTMRVTLTDRGAGQRDSIGITVWEGDRLLFSSGWNGSATEEVNLTASGGNLILY
ncbi:M12 family metallo-peptidase [Solwaraspora sp. WMMD1047]|uniref:M12 family metallo-peptidase n=1 Tax=Solwaraspora sp. WMMD1047 TaxID=3016102 RepID=UPI002416607D|nr:M12 family metallo-peptidase [Solwaraspora sp. WMMD1047]MDG4828306.1 M12 family metallo-peptidase [Solwaraspora sp. WMMD1047]